MCSWLLRRITTSQPQRNDGCVGLGSRNFPVFLRSLRGRHVLAHARRLELHSVCGWLFSSSNRRDIGHNVLKMRGGYLLEFRCLELHNLRCWKLQLWRHRCVLKLRARRLI